MINKKGSALMQVLLVTVVVATIATAILRIAISRTTTAATTVRTVSAKNILEGCNAEVQSKLVRGEIQLNSDGTLSYTCAIPAGPNANDIIHVEVKGLPVTDPTYNYTYTKLMFNIVSGDLKYI